MADKYIVFFYWWCDNHYPAVNSHGPWEKATFRGNSSFNPPAMARLSGWYIGFYWWHIDLFCQGNLHGGFLGGKFLDITRSSEKLLMWLLRVETLPFWLISGAIFLSSDWLIQVLELVQKWLYPSTYLSIYPSIDPSIDLSIYRSINLSIYQSIDLSIYRSINLSSYPSIHPFLRLSVYPSICLSAYPTAYLSIYLSI